VTVPVIIALHHTPQCEIEGDKENRMLAYGVRAHNRYKIQGIWEYMIVSLTTRTGVISNYIRNVACDNGAYGYICFFIRTRLGLLVYLLEVYWWLLW
jgi:hypothetical protein